MSDQLTLQSSGNAAASILGGGTERRITADSFRMLSARLRKPPAQVQQISIPDLMPVAAVIAPIFVASVPEPVFVAPFIEPVFVSPVIMAEPEPFIIPEPTPIESVWQTSELITPVPALEVQAFEVPAYEVPAFVVPEFVVPEFEPPQNIVPEFVEAAAAVVAEDVFVTEVSAPQLQVIEEPILETFVEEIADETHAISAQPESVELTDEELQDERAENARADREMLAIVHLIQAAPNLEDRTAYLAEVKEMQRLEAIALQSQHEDYAEITLNKENLLLSEEVSDADHAAISAEFAAAKAPKADAGDEDSGALARSLLDMMSSGGSSLPQERALAADTLLRLLPKLPLKSMIMLSERVAMMDQPSPQLVNKLIRDPRIEISGYLLENCAAISDQDLNQLIVERDVAKMRLIARRRKVARAVSDELLQLEDVSVMLTLVRNTGAEISHDGYQTLATFAARKTDILAPLCTRADLPAPVAFELFWQAPAQLRRYLLTRFLTDSETLSKILKITMATQGGDENVEGREKISEDVTVALALISASKIDEGARALAEIAKIDPVTMARIISDRQGEPIAILLKAIGFPRSEVMGALQIIQNSDFDLIQRDRDLTELNNTFESLSFNKARVLITYWDWAILKTGPYAPPN
jgi:uncharacterized protein (DUF2336 family)